MPAQISHFRCGSIVINSGGTLLTNAVNTCKGMTAATPASLSILGGTRTNGSGTNHITNLILAGGTVAGSIYPTNYGGFDIRSNYNIDVAANSTISAQGLVFEPDAGFNINSSTSLTPSGSIIDPTSHSGVQLSVAGGGTLIVTGTNTNTGPVQIDDSTLQIGNGGSTGSLGTGSISPDHREQHIPWCSVRSLTRTSPAQSYDLVRKLHRTRDKSVWKEYPSPL